MGQPASFYLDTLSDKVVFTQDEIYFCSEARLTKTDYSGNIIWSKEGAFNKIVVSGNAFYGLNGDTIFKADTSGNLLWAKRFSDPFCPGLFTQNRIYDLACDGQRIYLHAMQPPAVTPPYPPNQDFHPAVVVLDTAGHVLSVVCDSINNVHGTYQPEPCAASLRGGAWLTYHYSGGINSHALILRIDTNGIPDVNANEIDFGYGFNINDVLRIIPLPDSNYLALAFGQNHTPIGGIAAGFHLLKFDEYGTVHWTKSYTIAAPIIYYSILAAVDVTCDSMGSFYVSGSGGDMNVYGGNFMMKLDGTGNILFTKFWHPDSLISLPTGGIVYDYSPALHYKNGNIYCIAGFNPNGLNSNTAILIFDTAFYQPCYLNDSIIVCSSAPSISGFGTPIHFNTINSNIPDTPVVNFTLSSANSYDLCTALSAQAISRNDNALAIYPSPASSNVTVQGRDVDSGNLFLYNLEGQLVDVPISTGINQNERTLNLTALPAGVYYIRLFTNHSSKWGKLVKI